MEAWEEDAVDKMECLEEVKTSLNPFVQVTNEGKSLRKIAWKSMSSSSSQEKERVSLEEVSAWLQEILSKRSINVFQVCFGLALQEAKHLVKDEEKEGLPKKLFRLYMALLILYADMTCLYVMCNGKEASDDLYKEDFEERFSFVAESSDFVALKVKDANNAAVLYNAMRMLNSQNNNNNNTDTNSSSNEEEKDCLTLQGFTKYLLQREVLSNTSKGKLLAPLNNTSSTSNVKQMRRTTSGHSTSSASTRLISNTKHSKLASSPRRTSKPHASYRSSLRTTTTSSSSQATKTFTITKSSQRNTNTNNTNNTITSTPTTHLKKFQRLFRTLSEISTTPRSKTEKSTAWSQCNTNANPYVSLAEVDSWIKFKCTEKYKSQGDFIWKYFRPCFILAFDRAKNVAPPVSNGK